MARHGQKGKEGEGQARPKSEGRVGPDPTQKERMGRLINILSHKSFKIKVVCQSWSFVVREVPETFEFWVWDFGMVIVIIRTIMNMPFSLLGRDWPFPLLGGVGVFSRSEGWPFLLGVEVGPSSGGWPSHPPLFGWAFSILSFWVGAWRRTNFRNSDEYRCR